MLAQTLAAIVALGSVTFYLAAFFFPEVYRRRDFLWSGVGFFYALVLWLCAGQLRGGLLLGQAASVALLVWLGSQTLLLRRQQAAPEEKTAVSPAIAEKVQGFSLGKLLAPLTQRFQRSTPAARETPETVATLVDEPVAETEAAAESTAPEVAAEPAAEDVAAPSEARSPAADETESANLETSNWPEAPEETSNWPDEETSNWPDEETSNWPDEETSNWPDEETSNWPDETTADANWVDERGEPEPDPNPEPAVEAEAKAAAAAETANWVDDQEAEAIAVEATAIDDSESGEDAPVIGDAEPVAEPEQALEAVPEAAAIDSLEELPVSETTPRDEPDSTAATDDDEKLQDPGW